jgi:hypothetical protein
MSYGIILRVTHLRTIDSSIYLPDTHDGKDSNGRVQNQKSPQYVPVGTEEEPGYIDLVFTDQIAFSYQQGGIRGLITEGYITTSFIVNTDVSDAITSLGGLTSVSLTDNLATALNIAQGANSYLKFTTTNNAEAVVIGKSIVVNVNQGANAVATPLNTTTTYYVTGGAGETSTLADGVEGQIKILVMKTDGGGDMVVTVTNAAWGGATTVTLADVRDSCMLQYISGKWYVISNNGCAFA